MNPKDRPAETTTVAAGIAALIAHWLGVDDPTALAALIAVLAGLPTLVTAIVAKRNATPPTP